VNKNRTVAIPGPAPESSGDTAPYYRRRVLVAVPPGGFGPQLSVMRAWLDATCGPNGWAMAPAGTSGVVNDAVAVHFAEADHAGAFIRRFCCGYRG
jgi:hypothetical protein